MDLLKEPHRFDYYADQFEKVPLYFQTYFGSTHVDDVVSMIDYAVYTHDISHVVIDNLQFMLSGQGRGIERFDLQDDVVSKLRKLATTLNIHITLVIHPRKGEEGEDLTVSSIFGTAKSTQEADNVMILQQREKYRVIDVKKNRYDGEVGKSSLWFDKGSKRFEQITPKEIEELLNGAKLQDVIERKGRELRPDLLEISEESANLGQEQQTSSNASSVSGISYFQNSKSQGQITTETLADIMEKKAKDQNSGPAGEWSGKNPNYTSAFNKLEQIKLSIQKSTGRVKEPQVIFSRSRANKSATKDELETYNSKDTNEFRQSPSQIIGQSDPDIDQAYEDMFGVKFMEGSQEIDYDRVKFENKTGAEQKAAEKESSKPQPSGQQPAASPQSGSGPDPKVSALLGMQGSSMPTQEVTSMYEEGSVVVTYDQMIEELLEPGSKSRSKKEWSGQARKETQSSVVLSIEKPSKAKQAPKGDAASRESSKKKSPQSKNSVFDSIFPNLSPSEST